MKKLFGSLSVAVAVSLLLSAVAFANVPPPPVNQIIGIPDTVFSNLAEEDCRFCHEDPNIVDDANIPNRHHLLVGTTVPSGTCLETGDTCERNTDCPGFDPTVPGGAANSCTVHTDRPFPSGDTMGNYDCYSCHALVWDGSAFVLQTFRDCTFCHVQDPLAATVHHRTTKAKNLECVACHGPITDPRTNPDGTFVDGHTIPTYDPSLVTPCTSLSACGDANYKDVNSLPPGDPNATGGYCDFCHNAGTVTDPDFTDAFPPPIIVRSNSVNHHSTGLVPIVGQGPSSPECALCHSGLFLPAAIRGCETCHGFQSLHNIQADSNGDNQVIPNGEMPWWGHIGQNSDCRGCHGFVGTANAPGTGPVIPNIGILSAYNMVAGTDTTITISGSALTNMVIAPDGSEIVVESDVVLTAADGSTTTLEPNVITQSSMDVTIPGTLAAGNYAIQAVKGSSSSNTEVISIIPDVTIDSVVCDKKKGVLTVTGSGFGDKPEGTDADLNLQVNGQTVELISWTDTQIKASVDRCSKKDSVVVNALFGEDSTGSKCNGRKCR